MGVPLVPRLSFGTAAGVCVGLFVVKGLKVVAVSLGGVFVLLQVSNVCLRGVVTLTLACAHAVSGSTLVHHDSLGFTHKVVRLALRAAVSRIDVGPVSICRQSLDQVDQRSDHLLISRSAEPSDLRGGNDDGDPIERDLINLDCLFRIDRIAILVLL